MSMDFHESLTGQKIRN